MAEIRTNHVLLADENAEPSSPEKNWLLAAFLFTLFLHIALGLAAWLWRIDNWIPPAVERLVPRIFNISDVSERIKKNPPGTFAGGPTPEIKPGALRDVKPPVARTQDLEKALAVAVPRLSTPTDSQPALDQRPSVSLPPATLPSLLPLSDKGTIPVGANAAVGPSTSKPGTPQPGTAETFELPTSLPGEMASEDLSAIEGGGIGTVGMGGGALPEFTDVESLINSELRDLVMSTEGIIVRLSSEVLFDFNSDELKPDGLPTLEKVARLIQRYPNANVHVEGHSDTLGEASYNQLLSERRARAVGDWLRANLESPLESLTMQGLGESRPIVNPKGTIQQQKLNRRVEVRIKAESKP